METYKSKALLEAKQIARFVSNFGALNVNLLSTDDKSQEFDFIILASLPTIQSNKFLCSSLQEFALSKNIKIYNIDGEFKGEWIVFDFENFVVHIILEHARLKYKLDKLWKNSKNQLKY